MSDAWFVYVLLCADGSLYTGITKDVDARVKAHEAGKGAKYTRGRGPLSLCAVRKCAGKGAALSLELAVKSLTRKEKDARVSTSQKLGAFARSLGHRVRPAASAKRAASRSSRGSRSRSKDRA